MQGQGWSPIPNVLRENLLVPWDRIVGINFYLLPKWLSSFRLCSVGVAPVCVLAVQITSIETGMGEH